jgi:UDPglucose--hexose-1-phosphate uridylyltransferase
MSREHVHSQLVALPSPPPLLARELASAAAYRDTQGQCVFCALIDQELREASRIVCQSDTLLAFCPFASRTAFETWILPKQHSARFDEATDRVVSDTAAIVCEVLRRLEISLGPVAYNYLLHTIPFDMPREDHYHWHIEIIPRTARLAGLEWSSGLLINTVPPEHGAQRLRDAASHATIG